MPKIFLFNPGSEETWNLPEAPGYTPPKLVRKMMTDLSPMLRVLGSHSDLVFVPDSKNGFFVPCTSKASDFLCSEDGRADIESIPSEAELVTWAPQPCAEEAWMRRIRKHIPKLHFEKTSPDLSVIVDRQTASLLMKSMCENAGFPEYLIADKVKSVDEIAALVPSRGSCLLAKIPFSSSGRGVFPFEWPLKGSQLTLIKNALKRSSSLMIEKRLDLIQDYATEWKVENGSCSFEGYSFFETNGGGSYTGNMLLSRDAIAERLFGSDNTDLEQRILDLTKSFIEQNIASVYNGYIGVDALTYADINGVVRHYPAVEINLRCTMGWLALIVRSKLIAPDVLGRFVIVPEVLPDIFPEFDECGRLISGRLNIGSRCPKRKFSAVIEITKSL